MSMQEYAGVQLELGQGPAAEVVSSSPVTVNDGMAADQKLEMVAPATDLRLRARYLIDTLNAFAGASKLAGFRIAGAVIKADELERRYGPLWPQEGSGIGDEAAYKARQLFTSAKTSFQAAYEISHTGQVIAADDPGLTRGFGEFFTQFSGSRNHRALDRRRKNLQKIMRIPGVAQGGDTYTVEPEVTPASPPETASALNDETTSSAKLSTPEKLRVLREDSRAGFYPATNREKGQALTFLDYLDNDHYPARIAHQLQEVFLHQRRVSGTIQAAQDALLSLGFEFGDYFTQAHAQAAALDYLDRLVQDCLNPTLVLAEIAGADNSGYAPLVRFLDTSRLAETGAYPAGFDPLRTHEDRSPQAYAGKNKTVEDLYTAEAIPETVRARIETQVTTLTVGSLREVTALAVQNERRRADFWQSILYATRNHQAAWPASRAILERHGLPLNPQKTA